MGDTLAFRSDEGRELPTKRFGELETSFDPEIPEWGNLLNSLLNS